MFDQVSVRWKFKFNAYFRQSRDSTTMLEKVLDAKNSLSVLHSEVWLYKHCHSWDNDALVREFQSLLILPWKHSLGKKSLSYIILIIAIIKDCLCDWLGQCWHFWVTMDLVVDREIAPTLDASLVMSVSTRTRIAYYKRGRLFKRAHQLSCFTYLLSHCGITQH